MISQSPVSDLKTPQAGAREQIQSLVKERMIGRKTQCVAFMQDLLQLSRQVGAIHCRPAGNGALEFRILGCEPFEVELDASRGKLRMLCARLAVLCSESGQEFFPYGGEGTIRHGSPGEGGDTQSWKAVWSNTPDKHEFTIEAL